MGFFSRLFSGPPGFDILRLDILMQYSVLAGFGSAALRWSEPSGSENIRQLSSSLGVSPEEFARSAGVSLSSMPDIPSILDTPIGPGIQLDLVALLYGRTLCIHKETRAELFRRVDELAKQNVRTEGQAGFNFEPWVLHVGFGGGDHNLWPWHLTAPSNLHEPKVYSAVLKLGQPSRVAPLGRWIHLDMSFGQERILAPSSALIAITGFARACNQETRYALALMLWQMNAYWGSPKRVSLETEARAFAAARNAIKSGKLTVPE
jgi:hypothetical protein